MKTKASPTEKSYIYVIATDDELAVFSTVHTAVLNMFRYLIHKAKRQFPHICESLDFTEYEKEYVERRVLDQETGLFSHDTFIAFEGLDLLMDEHCDELKEFLDDTWDSLGKGVVPQELLQLCEGFEENTSSDEDGSEEDLSKLFEMLVA